MNGESAAAPVTLAMLKALHREHLSSGAAGTAAAIGRFADELGTSASAVVRGVRVATASAELQTAGWARAVLPYVDSAIACGVLDGPLNAPPSG